MPSERKIQIVKDLKEKISHARGLVLTDYQGLSVPEVEELREKLSKFHSDYQVVKNTLLQIVLRESSKFNPSVADQSSNFFGPTAILINYDEEMEPLKALSEFSNEHPAFKIKGGFFDGAWQGAAELVSIARLPSREELRARVVRMVQSPMIRFINVVRSNQMQLVAVLRGYNSKVQNPNAKMF